MLQRVESLIRSNSLFLFLIVFRWAALLPALLTLNDSQSQSDPLLPAFMFGVVFFANVVVSVFNRPLNKFVTNQPVFLGIDLFFSAFAIWASGGLRSPYYLYALSPLLAGALFFQMRGAFLVSLAFTPLYLFGVFYRATQPLDNVVLITQLAGVWLIPILFAYSSALLKSIHQANAELSAAHRQLEIIHDLTVLLQAAPDLLSVQERVLSAVTVGLGFSKAVVALVDPAREEIGGWMASPPDASFPAVAPLPLKSESGAVVKALLSRSDFVTADQTLIQDSKLNDWLRQNKWFVAPLYLREHPVGILLVEEAGLTAEKESTLMTVANQAALALGTTILCIDRARRLAVETERNRIARDIHDTVAQSLFGVVFSLDACVNMLPHQADAVRNELIELRALASNAHAEVRRSIFDLWPSALTIELFMADLTNHINACCRPRAFSVIFNHNGDFNSLPAGLRRTVYRMAQEALANSARYSEAQSARLCLTVTDDETYLVVSDDGKGFEPAVALSRNMNREHFGLHGIQERARAMGGDCEIVSQPNAGARIMINLPINGKRYA